MSENQDLRGVERTADQVAREAEGARDENERAAAGGQETDYAFRLPPDVAAADRLRAEDDVELNHRQQDAAEIQRRAAETLRRNAEALNEAGDALDRAQAAVRENRDDLREIQDNAQQLREQVAQAREQVESAEVPRVEPGPGGGREGRNAGNG